jgi:uncharacterized coiled-coil protein SlyX
VDQDLKTYLDEQFGRMEARGAHQDERLARLEERSAWQEERSARLEESSARQEEESRQTRVLIEGMWSNVRLLAEGVMSVIEQQASLRNEMNAGFQDVKASIAPAYQNLDRRLQWLEARAERKDRDVLDVIRERFGNPQA